jgi:site-specific recombinase XerD
MEEEKGCSQITIQGRLSLLRHFMKTMRPVKMDSITPQTIDEYLAIRKEKDGYSRRSISFVCTTLRSFFRYGASKGWNCEGLVASIKSPRIYHNEDLPSFTPWGTIQGILSGKSHGNGIAIRDYAVLLLLSVYGMRVSEVTGLKLKDLDWHNEQIYLRRAKGCRPQVFPILPAVGDAIIKYIKQFRYNENHCEYVFLRSFAPYGKLSNAAVYRLVCRELKATGVKLRHYGPHSLRHGRATQLINSGHSLKEIADILGHVRLNTTSIYAKVNLTSLREVAEMNWEGLV